MTIPRQRNPKARRSDVLHGRYLVTVAGGAYEASMAKARRDAAKAKAPEPVRTGRLIRWIRRMASPHRSVA
jgi:hypothetical protein